MSGAKEVSYIGVNVCRAIFMPDVEIKEKELIHLYVPLRGSGFTLAVFEHDEPIGWIKVETLGYDSVKDWIKAVGWVDSAFHLTN